MSDELKEYIKWCKQLNRNELLGYILMELRNIHEHFDMIEKRIGEKDVSEES